MSVVGVCDVCTDWINKAIEQCKYKIMYTVYISQQSNTIYWADDLGRIIKEEQEIN